jgi:ribosome maturation factor RimP
VRRAAICFVHKPIPSLMGNFERPWHAEFLEVHLMGIERSMFRGDRFSDRYNHAAKMETIYWRMGLVIEFSMN